MTSTSAARATLASAFTTALDGDGFGLVRPLTWVRKAGPEITHGIDVVAVKGAAYTPRWWVSLDFVPDVGQRSIRVSRSPAQARPHLVHDPLDFDEPDAWSVSADLGERRLRRRAGRIAARCRGDALRWFARADELEALTALLDDEAARADRVRFSFDAYLMHGVTRAFLCARLGRHEDAQQALDTWLEQQPVDAAVRTRLLKALDAASQGG